MTGAVLGMSVLTWRDGTSLAEIDGRRACRVRERARQKGSSS